jgi:hypothetical protein
LAGLSKSCRRYTQELLQSRSASTKPRLSVDFEIMPRDNFAAVGLADFS